MIFSPNKYHFDWKHTCYQDKPKNLQHKSKQSNNYALTIIGKTHTNYPYTPWGVGRHNGRGAIHYITDMKKI